MKDEKIILTKLISETNKKDLEGFYKREGMAIYIKGKLVLGVHPDNLENNIDALNDEKMKINWKLLYDNVNS